MQTTAQQWLVYELTHSAVLLGVFGFASQVPLLFLSSLGGYIGDHYNRHRGVITTQTASMVQSTTDSCPAVAAMFAATNGRVARSGSSLP